MLLELQYIIRQALLLKTEVMQEIPCAFDHWTEFRDTLTAVARAFGTFHRLDRFRDICIMKNPLVPED